MLQVLPALASGGVERAAIEISQALVDAGHRALVVSAGGRLLPALRAAGADHRLLDIGRKSPATLRHLPALRALCLAERVDIVHARSRLPAWIARTTLATLPHATRPRWMTTMHGLHSRSRYSAVMASGERVICVSRTVADHIRSAYPGTDPARLRVIPRGVDPRLFPRASWPDRGARVAVAATHPALGGDGPLLLLPGRGTRLKGHDDALALLTTLRIAGLDARLWMPGARDPARADYVAGLEARGIALGLADAVAITAPTDAIAAAYAASDVVLQLSRRPEAFGRTVVEALAVGRPVVGWAHGGVGELLHELHPAGAVAPFDAVALAATVARACDGHRPAGTMPVDHPYTLCAMQDATLAVYDELHHAPRHRST